MILGRATDRKVRLMVFILKTLQLQKENSPRRSGSFLCDQKEGNIHPFAHPGSPCMPHAVGMWPCMDADSTPFEERPLSKLQESDRCSARENLYLDALSLDDEAEEPLGRGPQMELRSLLPQVGLGAHPLGYCSAQGLSGSPPHGCRPLGFAYSSLWVEPNETFTMPRAVLGGPEPKLLYAL